MSVVYLYPTSDISTGWPGLGSHYDKVDEIQGSPNDSDYVSGNFSNAIDEYGLTDWTVPSGDEITQVDIMIRGKISANGGKNIKGMLRLNSSDSSDTNFYTYTTSFANNSWTSLARPDGGNWSDLSDLNGLTLKVKADSNSTSKSAMAYFSQCYVKVTYSASSSPVHPAPASPECDRSTNPTGIGENPIFTAIFQAYGGSGSATHYDIQVSKVSNYATTVWNSGWVAFTSSPSHGTRCEEIAYNGSALESGVTYYWHIKMKNATYTEGTYSANATFDGFIRDWFEQEFPFRKKITIESPHDAIAAGQILTLEMKTGNRRILADNGAFDEAIQASGGFMVARHVGITHTVFLSRVDPDGDLGIYIQSTNNITGEQGEKVKIDESGHAYDTHYFPTIDITPDGYIHVFYGCHYNSMKYRRSKYPNQSGSLSTDTQGEALWIRPDTGADGYMVPAGATNATYPIPFHIPDGDDAGRLYVIWRASQYTYRYSFSDDSGETWTGAKIFMYDSYYDDPNNLKYRLYLYGLRYDRVNRRLHLAWTHNHKVGGVFDTERGVWYAYCDYDEIKTGSTADFGFNLFRWADGSEAGYVNTANDGADAIDWTPTKAISLVEDELSKIFIINLVLMNDGAPVIFWEQKFDQGTNLWAHQTHLCSAKWSTTIGSAGSWNKSFISDQVNTLLRVRRSSIGTLTDKQGIIHALMPVSSKTEWGYLAVADVDSTGTITRASGSDNYAMIDDGFTHIDQTTWIKISGATTVLSFSHTTTNPIDITKIFSVDLVFYAKRTSSTASVKPYLSDGTTDDDYSAGNIDSDDIHENVASWTTNPFTSSAWVDADLEDLEFGLKCQDANETQLYSMYLRVTFTRATDENYNASEVFELTSSDGLNWKIEERSRNSMNGVPMMSNLHHISGSVIEVVWTAGYEIFYYSNEPYNLMLPTGIDVRITHLGITTPVELDRAANYWNLLNSKIYFAAPEAIPADAANGDGDLYIQFGHRNADDQPKGDPAEIWQGFWNFEDMDSGDSLSTHADWTIVSGTFTVYSGLTNHRNKVFAGINSVYSSGTTPEAKTIIGSALQDVVIEGAFWNEGSSSYPYIAARNAAGTEFRVGLNNGTNKAAYYDGTWHDGKPVGDRANMLFFKIVVTSSGCSAWMNGELVTAENNVITSVDEIRIGNVGGVYFDFIRWSKNKLITSSNTITTGFDDQYAYYETDHSSAVNSLDGHHNIDSSGTGMGKIRKIEIQVQVKHNTETGLTVDTHVHLCNKETYDPDSIEDDTTHQFTGVGTSWSSSYTFTFTDLKETPKSIKLDCYGSDAIEADDTVAQIYQIKSYYFKDNPVLLLGDLESRGFRSSVTLEGSGLIAFFADVNTDAHAVKSYSAFNTEIMQALSTENPVNLELKKSLSINGQISYEISSHIKAYLHAVFGSMERLQKSNSVNYGLSGQITTVGSVYFDTLKTGTQSGQVALALQEELSTMALFPIEAGLSIDSSGQVITEVRGSLKDRKVVILETLQAIDFSVAVPFDVLRALIIRGTSVFDWLESSSMESQIIIGYLAKKTSVGTVQLEQLVLVSATKQANLEIGAGSKTTNITNLEMLQTFVNPGGYLLPFALIGAHKSHAQAIVEFNREVSSQSNVVLDTGVALTTYGQTAIEFLGTLLTSPQIPFEFSGGVLVRGYGSFPFELKGSVKVDRGTVFDVKESIDPITQSVVLSFNGSINIDQRVLFETLSSKEIQGQVVCDNLESITEKLAAFYEFGEMKYAGGQAPIDIKKTLEVIRSAPFEMTGGVELSSIGLFPFEWVLNVSADGQVVMEKLIERSVEAIAPFSFGTGHLSMGKANYSIDQLASIIHQVSIETLTKISEASGANFDIAKFDNFAIQTVIETGVRRVIESQAVYESSEFAGLSVLGSFPIELRSSLASEIATNYEVKTSREIIAGNVVIEWGLNIDPITSQFVMDIGEGVREVSQVLAEFLGTQSAKAVVNFGFVQQTEVIMQVSIDWGLGMTTRSTVPVEILRAMTAEGQFPAEWIGFAVTMFVILSAEARMPGITGATVKLPEVMEAIAKKIEISDAKARLAEPGDAFAKLVKILNAKAIGGVE